MTDAAAPAGPTPATRQAALLRLMAWLSPAFPVGAFAFSHGLEAAIAERQVGDADDVFDWVRMLVTCGSGWNDLVLFAEAHHAARLGDAARLADVAELGAALGGTRERREEALALGTAFAAASLPWREDDAVPEAVYPVAVARLAARSGIALGDALTAFAHAFTASLVGAATRLVPLGQSDAVRVLRRLEPVVLAAAERAAGSTPDDLGSAAILSEIAAMRHETLSTRLFRS